MLKQIALALACLFHWSSIVHANDVSFSQRTLTDDPVMQLSIWQPSSNPDNALVVISAGLGGSSSSLHSTAEAIASRGITVVSPQHSSDYLFGSNRHMFFMENRADELLRTRQWAIDNLQTSEQHIGLFGYSQGGLSVMIAAGITPDRSLARHHCKQNRADDRGFCGYASFWQGIAEKLGISGLFEGKNFTENRPTAAFAALGVAAPVAVFVPADQFAKLDTEAGIFSFEADRALAPHFHSDHLHRALGDKPHTYKSYANTGHGGLFSANSDRINNDIADFFAEKL